MRIYSIVFQAMMAPEKIALYTTCKATSPEEAMKMAKESIVKINGDLMWKELLANAVDYPDIKSEVVKTETVDTIETIKETKNWALQTVIKNNDKKLLTALTPYLSEPEKLFIKDKIV